jgi:hypothetical protein
LLEELITSELQGALEEVSGGGRTETSPDGASTLVRNDLSEATDEAAVVCCGVELDPRLDAGRKLAGLQTSDSCRELGHPGTSHWRTSIN